MILRATGGDPRDEAPTLHHWMWAELFTKDPDRAAAFYGSVVGYRSRTVVDRDGERFLVLGQGGKARATVVKIPWPGVEPNWVPYLYVRDVVGTLRKVDEHGGEVVYVPGDDPSFALVADPHGAVFAVQEKEVR